MTFNKERSCLGHGEGWGELSAMLHYSVPAVINFNACTISVIFHSAVYSRKSDLRSTKKKDAEVLSVRISSTMHYIEKALSLIQAPMMEVLDCIFCVYNKYCNMFVDVC